MKNAIGFAVLAAVAAGGCAQQAHSDPDPPVQKLAAAVSPPGADRNANLAPARQTSSITTDDRIIAKANGEPITYGQLLGPLIEAHGLPMLLNIVQLELAKQDAREQHVTVTPEDIAREQEMTMAKAFKETDAREQDQLDAAERKGDAARAAELREQIRKDRETMLAQLLENQHSTRAEYDMVVQINAYLRKMIEPLVRGKITEKMVEEEFGIQYGETIRVRYIQLANMQEVGRARQRIKAGEKFEDVARDMSRNARTAALGGEMPAFSRQMPGVPQAFKDLAFSLQPGDVSETLNYGGNFYILQCEQRLPPKAIKFADVKESLRQGMYERIIEANLKDFRYALAEQALAKLKIEDPLLARQFDELKAKREAAIRDRQQIDAQLRRERELNAATQPTTQPAAVELPATRPTATAPASQP